MKGLPSLPRGSTENGGRKWREGCLKIEVDSAGGVRKGTREDRSTSLGSLVVGAIVGSWTRVLDVVVGRARPPASCSTCGWSVSEPAQETGFRRAPVSREGSPMDPSSIRMKKAGRMLSTRSWSGCPWSPWGLRAGPPGRSSARWGPRACSRRRPTRSGPQVCGRTTGARSSPRPSPS